MSDLYIGAYWGARQESIDQCANRLMACIKGLHDCDEIFAKWFEKGKSRSDALGTPFDFRSPEKTLGLLESGRNKRDLDRTIIRNLGFSANLWNGGTSPRSASINVTCGLFIENPNLRNSVVIGLPEELGDLSNKDRCLLALRVVVEAWEPDWAGVISRSSRNSRPFNPSVPFVDWMLYVNRIAIDRTKLPTTAQISEISGKGTIVIVQDQPIDAANPTDIRNVTAVESVIGVMR